MDLQQKEVGTAPKTHTDIDYVRERITSIHNTEMKLVSFLDNFSKLLTAMHDVNVEEESEGSDGAGAVVNGRSHETNGRVDGMENDDDDNDDDDDDDDMEDKIRAANGVRRDNLAEQEKKMKQLIDNCYDDLSNASVHLRRELKLLELKLPLPPNLSKKASGTNNQKLKQLLTQPQSESEA
jgi:hypothetical protein